MEIEKEYELQLEGNEIVFYYQDVRKSLSDAEVIYEDTYYYTGKEIEPIVEIKFAKEKLTEKENYNVYSFNNIELGKGYFVVVGVGLYSGFEQYEFEIIEKKGQDVNDVPSGGGNYNGGSSSGSGFRGGGTVGEDLPAQDTTQTEEKNDELALIQPTIKSLSNGVNSVIVKWDKVSEADGYYIYRKTGTDGKWKKVKTIVGSEVISWKDKKTKNGTQYGYKICAYKGDTISKKSKAKVMYRLEKTTIKSLKQTSEQKAEIQYTTNKKGTGYQIQYSTSSKYAKSKTMTVYVKDAKKLSKVLSDLKKDKKYYVRIRVYKTVNGRKYYSGWNKKVFNLK